MQIKDIAALVTGGGSGLGAATARLHAHGGARVGILDVNADKGEAVAREIGGMFARCDVADAANAEAAIAACHAAHGPARVLINCAGIATGARIVGREGPMELGEFERTIRVNLVGSFNMMRLAAAEMSTLDPLETGERGVVVSTASVAAYEGQIGQAAYAASKGGIVSLTLPAAREFARFGIRVNAIAPGLMLTPLVDGLPQETQDGLAEAIPFPHRLGKPEEFANLVAAIIGNTYLNGEVIRLDGALRMQPK